MNFSIPNEPMGHALAESVHRRIDKDASYVSARAALWRCLGYSFICVALGGAVGLAFFGYSYVSDGQAAMGKLSQAIADGLNKVVIQHAGEIKLDTANSSVPLDTKDGVVKLDTGDGTVRLDTTNSRVQVAGTVKVDGASNPRPSERQMDVTARPQSQAKTVTDYTIFKTVQFDNGDVVTGWVFSSNEDTAPSRQYCYYSRKVDDQSLVRFNIAMDGAMVPASKDMPVDSEKAYTNCVWFNNK